VVEVYVAALRRKLGPEWIGTVRGLGYRFAVPADDGAGDTTPQAVR
jgi:DNA-binding response OmpR family regulator